LKTYILILTLFLVKVSPAQFENTDVGARAVALSGAFTAVSNNSQAIFYNPAGLAQMKYRELSFFLSPAPFGMTELSTAALSFAEPLKTGVIGAAIKAYGYELYRETSVYLSYGNNYKNRIFYGGNVNLYYLKIQDNSAASIGIDLGAMAYLTPYIRWGFFGKNITGSTIGLSKEKIVQVYRSGLNYQPLPELSLILEFEKDVKYPVSVRGGFEYSLMDYVDLRFGVGNEPSNYSSGIGFNYDRFTLDYALYKSQDLGITHQGTITLNFGGVKSRKESRAQIRKAFE